MDRLGQVNGHLPIANVFLEMRFFKHFSWGFFPKCILISLSSNSNMAAHNYHACFLVSRALGGEPRVLVLVSKVAAALAVYHRITLVAEHEILLFLGRVRLVDLPG